MNKIRKTDIAALGICFLLFYTYIAYFIKNQILLKIVRFHKNLFFKAKKVTLKVKITFFIVIG